MNSSIDATMIIALASHVGRARNQYGASIEPELDEIDLGLIVAREALNQLSKEQRNVDRIIFASSGIRQIFPCAAIEIASRLNQNCPAFDVSAACTSLGLAVESAASMKGRSLVIGADCMSRTIDSTDPSHRPLLTFADGAAAIVVDSDGQNQGQRIVGHHGLTDGRWRTFYGSEHGKLTRSLPREQKRHLRSCYISNWVQIIRHLRQLMPYSGRFRIYPNQGDKALFPALVSELGIAKDRIVATTHGHAGGADPWIGLDTCPLAAGESAILLSSGIGFEFHGILIEQP